MGMKALRRGLGVATAILISSLMVQSAQAQEPPSASDTLFRNVRVLDVVKGHFDADHSGYFGRGGPRAHPVPPDDFDVRRAGGYLRNHGVSYLTRIAIDYRNNDRRGPWRHQAPVIRDCDFKRMYRKAHDKILL